MQSMAARTEPGASFVSNSAALAYSGFADLQCPHPVNYQNN